MSVPPAEAHCLACRSKQPFSNPVMASTKFNSHKKGVPMERSTWVGVCGKCGKKVQRFAVKEREEKKEEIKEEKEEKERENDEHED